MKALGILRTMNRNDKQVNEAIAELEALEKELADMHYKFSCVIDNATGGKLSKPDYKIEAICSAINENVSRWMQMAADEVREYELQAPKTCEGCKHINSKGSCYDCSRYYIDYYEPKDKQ